MKIPPSTYNAYNICPRQAWLMSRHLNADQSNSFIEIGRIIDDFSFDREKKKIFLADLSAEIDMVTKRDGQFFIAEIKKSSKKIESAEKQLKYYLYLLKKYKNIEIKGIIKIPKEKISKEVVLNNNDIVIIENKIKEIIKVLESEHIPEKKRLKICPKCGHFEFCWA